MTRLECLRGVIVALPLLLVVAASTAHAQLISAPDADAAAAVELPEPLTAEAVRALIARLSDAQVRELLLRQLDAAAADEAAASAEADGGVRVVDYPGLLAANFAQTVERLPRVWPALKQAARGHARGRTTGALLVELVAFVAALIGGVLVAAGVNRGLRRPRARIEAARPDGLVETVQVVVRRIALDLVVWLAFLVASALLVRGVCLMTGGDHRTALSIVDGIAKVAFMWMLTRFLFAPTRPDLRLTAVDDGEARFISRQLLLAAGLTQAWLMVRDWLVLHGMTLGDTRLGFWFTAAQYAVIAWMLWRARDAFARMIVGRDASVPHGTRVFARIWPLIAVALVVGQWLVIELFVATGNVSRLPRAALDATLLLILLLPMIDTSIRAIARHFYPADDEDAGVAAMRRETQAGIVRCSRVLLVIAAVFGIASLWGLNLFAIAEQGVGARLAGGLVNSLLILAIGYAVWEATSILAGRALAKERAALGQDDESAAEGEAGGSGSRILTLVPIFVRTVQVVLVVLVVLAVLGELGINVTPLLAGAGILGLAVGFGAQTLVKDIVSGVFFLLDDAFRVGEYIDVEGTTGTVERISMRSLRLRHHRGALHTIPYGEMPKLTNFSRDWVIVKLKFRVPFDTDIDKVRKIFKQIGRDLLADEELGPDFIQPFKSQGVLEMDDSGIVVRGKFMAKPGKQFMIQRQVYVQVKKAFEENGIDFARKQVIVHVPASESGDSGEIAAAAAEAALDAPDAAPSKA